jgi:hypothetical protein
MIYPNPASKYLIISNMYNLQHIDIQAITGLHVWSQKINGEESISIPLEGLRNGIYIICLNCNGKLLYKKFIKVSE